MSEERWLVFRYLPVALFSLKTSRATSTAGKTLLIPTPWSVKMAFLDAALRAGAVANPENLVRGLRQIAVRIGVPRHACVTGTIQSVRQQTRPEDRKRNPKLPPYRPNIALREFVHYSGTLGIAWDLTKCSADLIALLLQTAPSVNYFGKRGSFVQYLSSAREVSLDSCFTMPAELGEAGMRVRFQRTALDDFGPQLSFQGLNSFTSTDLRRGPDRMFVETIIPLQVHNSGPGFVHYSNAAG